MPQPIASRVVTDACHVTYQTLLSSVAQFASWFIKVRKMADDFNNASRFYRFTIPTHRRGPHLFHDTGVQNQFSQYSQLIATAFYAACFSRAKFRGAHRWKQLNRNRWPDWSENQHKRDHQERFVSHHFWNVRAFVIWIVWASGLNFGSNFRVKTDANIGL